MHMAVKTASIAVGALAFITTFSACSSSQEAVSSSTTASAAAGIDRQAGNLGTRVCIVNESTKTATVLFTKRDTARGEGPVAPGNQACGEGTFGTGQDVEASATMEFGSMKFDVQAANPVWWPPIAKVFMNKEKCIVVQGDQGTVVVYDDGLLRYTVQRLADGQWKEFTITFTESVQPSGRLANCVWDS
jgi:hypothetical protein